VGHVDSQPGQPEIQKQGKPFRPFLVNSVYLTFRVSGSEDGDWLKEGNGIIDFLQGVFLFFVALPAGV
jgi:hypothetical protein